MKHLQKIILIVVIQLCIVPIIFAQAPPAPIMSNQTICGIETTSSIDPDYVWYDSDTEGYWVSGGDAVVTNSTVVLSEVTNLQQGVNRFYWIEPDDSPQDVSVIHIIFLNTGFAQSFANYSQCNNYANIQASTSILASGYSGMWSIVNGGGSIFDETGSNTWVIDLGVGENVIEWTVTNGVCSDSHELTIINNSFNAQVLSTNGDTICDNNSTLQGNIPPEGLSGTWSIENGGGIISEPTNYNSSVNSLALGENVFRWTIKKANCESFAETSITNNSVTAHTQISMVNCENTAVIETNELNIGETGTWEVIEGAGAFETGTQNVHIVTNLAPLENIFRWAVQNGNCQATDDISVSNYSITVDAGEDTVICQNSVSLSGRPLLTGETGEWSVIVGEGTITETSSESILVSNLSSGENVFTCLYQNAFCSDLDEITINNYSLSPHAGEDTVVCESSGILSAIPLLLGESGMWETISGAGVVSNNTSEHTTVISLSEGDNVFRWTVNNDFCQATDEISIKSYPVFAHAGDAAITTDSSYTLSGNSDFSSAFSGLWTSENTNLSFENNSLAYTIVSNLEYGDNVISWMVSSNECSVSDDVVITRNVFAGEDIYLQSNSTTLDALLPQGTSGEWSVISGNATFTDITSPFSGVSGFADGISILRWTVTFPDRGIVMWDEVEVNKTVGLTEDVSQFNIYPNPSSGILILSSQTPLDYTSIQVFDVFGRQRSFKILENNPNKLILNLTQQGAGLYFIKINVGSTAILKKFLIN